MAPAPPTRWSVPDDKSWTDEGAADRKGRKKQQGWWWGKWSAARIPNSGRRTRRLRWFVAARRILSREAERSRARGLVEYRS